jgi:signal transduction histidine kinase
MRSTFIRQTMSKQSDRWRIGRSRVSGTRTMDDVSRSVCDFRPMTAALELLDNGHVSTDEKGCRNIARPAELASNDPEVLRAGLLRVHQERERAECLAAMQAAVSQLALDLLVTEPDIEGFFGGLTRNMVEQSESLGCSVWLIDEHGERCSLWMAYYHDRLYTKKDGSVDSLSFPHKDFADHLFSYKPGWQQTIDYRHDDGRLPDAVREFQKKKGCDGMVLVPLVIGTRTLGWFKLMTAREEACPEAQWWRQSLTEAIARMAALALHFTGLIQEGRREERQKAILEERNRLARDIHDNLAQGFGAILMQLQAAKRDCETTSAVVGQRLDTVIDLARTHLVEARRSVGTLRPNVGDSEAMAVSLRRIADLARLTTQVPIELNVDDLPRVGDVIEREIVSIAQEALTNAVRHARAQRITLRASAVRSIGVRLSIADDGRGFARDRHSSGFGMTSMQERAERIGASLTIVTAPRSGTEVVLAWEPSSQPAQVHVAV